MHPSLVLVTHNNLDQAKTLSQQLVQEKLCACVNLVPNIQSIFNWENRIYEEQEVLMLIKTTKEKYKALKQWIVEHHPYDTPEIIQIDIAEVEEKYLAWFISSLSTTSPKV